MCMYVCVGGGVHDQCKPFKISSNHLAGLQEIGLSKYTLTSRKRKFRVICGIYYLCPGLLGRF